MKYDFGSDLHVDVNARAGTFSFKDNKTDDSNVLVLAGDISNDPYLTAQVLAAAASNYEEVIFVDGNHEHYSNTRGGVTVMGTMDYFRLVTGTIQNLTYLDGNTSTIIDGVMFVGANAWYDFKMQPEQYTTEQSKNAWKRCMNDHRLSNFDRQPEILAMEQAAAITKQVADAQTNPQVEKIVVVTHTIPSSKGVLIKHDPTWDMLNGAFGCVAMEAVFASDVNRKIVHSLFGHTHYNYDFDDFDGIRFICNPRGYHGVEGDVTRWNIIQLDTTDTRP